MLASRSRPRESEHHRRRCQSGSQKNRANQCTAAIRLDAGGSILASIPGIQSYLSPPNSNMPKVASTEIVGRRRRDRLDNQFLSNEYGRECLRARS